jgi:photosystem II stability/assembly factor-like uncharacterized protein
VQQAYFKESTTVLVRLLDSSVWQSSNEGYTWNHLFPEETFLAFYHHFFTPDRAYLITPSGKFFYTTDTGRHVVLSHCAEAPEHVWCAGDAIPPRPLGLDYLDG